MNIPEFSNMEIDNMQSDELLKSYISLQKVVDKIGMDMDFMKKRIRAVLEAEGKDRFSNQFGEASLMKVTRNLFQQKIAKNFLTDEQIKKCYIPSNVEFVKIVSAEAKANQVY